MAYRDARSWTDFFFSQSSPTVSKVDYETQVDLKPFHLDREKWLLWEPVATGRRSGQDVIQVLWLVIKYHGKMVRKYVAKVFPEYTEHDAQLQLQRVPDLRGRGSRVVMNELDPFLNEARVFQRIEKCCDKAQKIYFPRFYGVVTDLARSDFRSGYPNRRAIILEAIQPKLTSRRILAAQNRHGTGHIESLRRRLQDPNLNLSDFEKEYYCSLLADRCHRLVTLHSLAITYGDVKDEHFRLPGDFYDTVLYDFSISYTFSPEQPYLVNFRPPNKSLKDISHHELNSVEEQVYERAKKLDLRDHIAKSTTATQKDIQDALIQPPEDGPLELIILRVKIRPDAFSMPSLNSVFPFLEAICPLDDPTWHIRRGRQLDCFESAWLFCQRSLDTPDSVTLVSISHRLLTDAEHLTEARGCFLLCLIPRKWGVEGVHDQLLRVCTLLMLHSGSGHIISQVNFYKYK